MYVIQHNSDNFTIIDCNLPEERKDQIVNQIRELRAQKTITRFISTP
jgi:hypothetical protein